MNQPPLFYSGAKIAKALGVHKKTIHRKAVKAGWDKRNLGYRWEYSPPLSILSKVWENGKNIPSRSSKRRKLSIRLEDIYDSKQIERIRLREMAVQMLHDFVEKSIPKEKALLQVPELMRRFQSLKIGVGSLRQWEKNYKEHGIDGLVEQKLGRVGRKSKTFIAAKEKRISVAETWTKLGSFNFRVEGLVDTNGGIKEIRIIPA